MKRIAILLVFAMLSSGTLFASDGMSSNKDDARNGDASALDMTNMLGQATDRTLGSLTVGEMLEFAGRLSVIQQQNAFINHSRMASFMFPGVGELINKDTAGGILYIGADLLAVAGTLVGSYLLLPADLKFDQLDYFGSPISTIKAAWESKSLLDLLPSSAVVAGGMLLDMILRAASSHHAARLARDRVESGQVTFEPQLSLMPGGGFGMGAHMRY